MASGASSEKLECKPGGEESAGSQPWSNELTTGAAVSKILADRGVKVAINYSSNKDRAEQTRAGLAGSGHVLVPGDAFSHDGVNKIAAEAIKGLGGLDIVVSNVGWTQFANFNDIGECWPRGSFQIGPQNEGPGSADCKLSLSAADDSKNVELSEDERQLHVRLIEDQQILRPVRRNAFGDSCLPIFSWR